MNILVFGGTGTLGGACADLARLNGNNVIVTSRTPDFGDLQNLGEKFNAVIWAQGLNINDTAATADQFDTIFEANVGFIVKSLQRLISARLLAGNARLVIISSVWDQLSRENKFSYSVSKAALLGFLNSVTADYAKEGITCNAVRPGVVDTPTTRKMLSERQIKSVIHQTPTRTLVSPAEVAQAVLWLASPLSSGVAGQIFAVDNGWSHVRDL